MVQASSLTLFFPIKHAILREPAPLSSGEGASQTKQKEKEEENAKAPRSS